MAYVFDHAMGPLGIPCWTTLFDGPLRREFFVIVSQAHAAHVEAFIARVEERPRRLPDPPVPTPDATEAPKDPQASDAT